MAVSEGPWSAFLTTDTVNRLVRLGWESPYLHQARAVRATLGGEDVVVATSTGSGKSACFVAPALEFLQADPGATILMLFPTKALLRDQEQRYRQVFGSGLVAIDGDAGRRERERAPFARVLVCTPDMLHAGVLPRNDRFASFLSRLRMVCLDEAHAYHGVFGSHVANVFRRLFRFAPPGVRMVLASATSANASEHARSLTGRDVTVVREEGAPSWERLHAIVNPPLIDERLGVRAEALDEALAAAETLLAGGARGVVFVPSRMMAERAALSLKAQVPDQADRVFVYRSGLLAQERRAVEEALRSGSAGVVVSTSALELGVDFGSLDFVLHVGYPGSVAAYRQRAGRAGRDGGGLSVLVVGPGPLDQYVARHPDHLQGGTEWLVADPDNLSVLTEHVRCALYEASFPVGVSAFPYQEEILEFLAEDGEAVQTRLGWRALALDRPAASVGLRSVGRRVHAVSGGRVVATAAIGDAQWLWHPGAVYVHAGTQYVVEELDLEGGAATLEAGPRPWFTTALSERDVEVLGEFDRRAVKGGSLGLLELLVRTTVTGFARRSWESGERLGGESLELPP
ncbi:MAG: DEAD/DEAH box helicase, partial [Planctomycetota bacterium]